MSTKFPSLIGGHKRHKRHKRHKIQRDVREKMSCPICLDEKVEDPVCLPCDHLGCRECVIGMIKTAISDKEIPRCGLDKDCKVEIPTWIIEQLLDKKEVEEHYKNLLELQMAENECFWCPGKCGSLISFENPKEVVRFECPDCKKVFCFRCKCEWHKDTTCERYQKWKEENKQGDTLIFEYIKRHNVKTCPKCGLHIEKNKGCDHMTCKKCRYEWWWSTGKPYHSLQTPVLEAPPPPPRLIMTMPLLIDGKPTSKTQIFVRLNALLDLLDEESRKEWLAESRLLYGK